MDQSLMQKVLGAVENGNSRTLNYLLGCQQHAPDGPSLLPSPDGAQILLESWRSQSKSRKCDSKEPSGFLSLGQRFRALLMIRPYYITPWEAINDMIKQFTRWEAEEAVQFVPAVDLFLQEFTDTSAERTRESLVVECGKWIEKAIKSAVEHVFAITTDSTKDTIILLGDLLFALFTFSKTCLDEKKTKELLGHIFGQLPSSSTINNCLETALRLRSVATAADMKRLLGVTLDHLAKEGPDMSLVSLISLSNIGIDAAVSVVHLPDGESCQKLCDWYRIPLRALMCVQNRKGDYAALERHLLAKLMEFSSFDLEAFCTVLDAEGSLVDWIKADILLVACHCVQKSSSEMVFNMFARGKKTDASISDIKTACATQLLDIFFPGKDSLEELGLTGQIEEDETLVVEVLGDLTYTAQGKIVDPDGLSMSILSGATRILLNLISMGDSGAIEDGENRSQATRRGNTFLGVVECMDFQQTKAAETRSMLFSILLKCVLFHEMPECRFAVCETLRRALLSTSKDTFAKNASVATLALVVSSVGNDITSDNGALDSLIALVACPLDCETFTYLAVFVSSNPIGRRTILSRSTTLLNSAFTCSWEPRTTSQISIGHGDRVRAGLFGLLELIRGSSWQDVELEAWRLLSNCIVLDSPHLQVADRAWFYENLFLLLEDGELSKSAARRCFGVAAARLSGFALKDDDMKMRFIPENAFIAWEDPLTSSNQTQQMEDIVSLIRLSLSLLFRQNALDLDESRQKVLEKTFHQLLLSRILDSKSHNVHVYTEDPSKQLKPQSDDHLPSEFSFLLQYLLVVCDYFVPVESAMLRAERHDYLQDYLGSILKSEQEALEPMTSGYLGGLCTSWWNVEAAHLFSKREIDVEPSVLTSVESSSYDLLIEIVCGNMFQRYRQRGHTSVVCRRIVAATGRLLELKQKLPSPLTTQGSGSISDVSRMGGDKILNSASEFFTAASRVVQDLLLQSASLEEAEEIFVAIILFCREFELEMKEEVQHWPTILRSLWALYQVTCSEKGASRLLAYLESNVTSEASASKTDTSVCSLKSMRSGNDVDESMRNIRLSILRVLEKSLQVAAMTGPTSNMGRGDGGANMIDFHEDEASLVVSILKPITHDLQNGLEGHSGGMTTEMFEKYLSCVQTSATLVYFFALQHHVAISQAVFPVFAEVTFKIRNILRSFELEDAALFRSSLIIAMAEIPAFSRELLRRYLMSSKMPESHIGNVMNPERNLILRLFNECIALLKRWSALRDPNSVPWTDIAGRLHTSDVNEDEKVLSVERSTLGVNGTMNEGQKNEETIEIRLRTKALWSWSMSCTFVAFEELWLESYRSLAYDLNCPKNAPNNYSKEGYLHFLSLRQDDLRSSLQQFAELFSSSTPHVDSQIQQAVLDVLAMNLPSAPRLRFCHCIATVSKVLKYSIQRLRTVMGSDTTTVMVSRDTCLESLSTLGAWLTFDDQKTDFAVGTFRWLSVLRRKSPPGERQKKRIDTTELVPWVTRVSLLIRDLHAELKNLERVLIGHAEEVEAVVPFKTFFPRGLADVIRLTSQKLRLLELTMPSEYSAPSLPDFPSLDEPNKEKKKRPRRYVSTSRPKKRAATQLTKSRNRIVNTFMRLDQKSGEKNEGKVDAFVDLEDFLVEG